ncbi:hypothetical protein LCGC14_1813780 [marine sediment metagenome]|uniref:Uncharacterized protein n=1 Tax=marine sediment metagenome TaxID=412755 RepID=A0A0F9JKK5_9ZZZZ
MPDVSLAQPLWFLLMELLGDTFIGNAKAATGLTQSQFVDVVGHGLSEQIGSNAGGFTTPRASWLRDLKRALDTGLTNKQGNVALPLAGGLKKAPPQAKHLLNLWVANVLEESIDVPEARKSAVSKVTGHRVDAARRAAARSPSKPFKTVAAATAAPSVVVDALSPDLTKQIPKVVAASNTDRAKTAARIRGLRGEARAAANQAVAEAPASKTLIDDGLDEISPDLDDIDPKTGQPRKGLSRFKAGVAKFAKEHTKATRFAKGAAVVGIPVLLGEALIKHLSRFLRRDPSQNPRLIDPQALLNQRLTAQNRQRQLFDLLIQNPDMMAKLQQSAQPPTPPNPVRSVTFGQSGEPTEFGG